MARGSRSGQVPYLEQRGLHVHDTLIWIEVSSRRPCPACGALSGCAVSGDRRFAHCHTTPSKHPTDDGGWLHDVSPDDLGAWGSGNGDD